MLPREAPALDATHYKQTTRQAVGEATFDTVICRLGLIYFPDRQRAVRAMWRALKPGGRIATVYGSSAPDSRIEGPHFLATSST